MTREITYPEARRNLARLMDEVADTCEPILIRRRGKEPVALIAADELTSWMETAYLLRSPAWGTTRAAMLIPLPLTGIWSDSATLMESI